MGERWTVCVNPEHLGSEDERATGLCVDCREPLIEVVSASALKRCEERGELRLAQLDRAAQHAVEIEAKCERLEGLLKQIVEAVRDVIPIVRPEILGELKKLYVVAGEAKDLLSTPKTEGPDESFYTEELGVRPKTEGER